MTDQYPNGPDARGLAHEITTAFYNKSLDLSSRPHGSKQGWEAMPEVTRFRLQ
jgi:hypothetical protein